MAIGDIVNLFMTTSFSIDIKTGDASNSHDVSFTPNFNPRDYEIAEITFETVARQPYLSGAEVKTTAAYGNGAGMATYLNWGAFDSSTKSTIGRISNLTQVERRSVNPLNVRVVYDTAFGVAGAQTAEIAMQIKFAMRQIVANPSGQPSPGGINHGWGWDLVAMLAPVLVVGVVAVAGLYAIGYASEKTGVNVAVASNVYRGLAGAAGSVRSKVGGIRRKKQGLDGILANL